MTTAFDDWIDLNEAAHLLHIHPQSFRRVVHLGQYPKQVHLFAGKYLFHREEVREFQQTYDPRPGRRSQRRRLL